MQKKKSSFILSFFQRRLGNEGEGWFSLFSLEVEVLLLKLFFHLYYGVATVCLHNTVSGKLQHSAPGCFVLLIKFFTAHWSLEATVPN